MLRLFREHLEANKAELQEYMIEGNLLDQIHQRNMLRLQGQINAFEKVLSIKEMLLDLSEDYPEVNKDEV